MASQEGTQVAALIREKLAEINSMCKNLDENTASRSPEGRWTPKEIISHLYGPEGIGTLPALQLILGEDTPLIEIEPANPYYTGKRREMTFQALLAEFNQEYGKMADLMESLSQEQLARKAHIPLFKDLPIGEYPSLLEFVQALAEFHLVDHIEHLRDILKTLGVSVSA